MLARASITAPARPERRARRRFVPSGVPRRPRRAPRTHPPLVLVHDYLTQMGGAERVMADLAEKWPEAEIRTLLYSPATTFEGFRGADVRTSALQPLARRLSHRVLFPLMPAAMRTLEVEAADLVLSSSSGWAHAVRVPPGTPHVCYCHSPARWLYGDRSYVRRPRVAGALNPVLGALRAWDRDAATRPHLYVANSRNVQARIREVYGRDAVVVHPPVDVHRYRPSPPAQDGYLLVLSRLLAYKRIDVAIAAAAATGRRLVIAGEGPERTRLEQFAGPDVTFLGRVPDAMLSRLFAGASALLQCGEEDFGIAVLEANAAGRPVVALGRGGALETVRDGETGVLFDEPTAPAAATAIATVLTRTWDPAALNRHAAGFAPGRFIAELSRIVQQHLGVPLP